MTEEKLREKESAEESATETKWHTLKLLLIIALAFLAAIVFRRSSGILAMFPIAFILCAAAAFIDLKPSVKCLIFAVMVFTLNTVEQSDMTITLTFTALCLLANVVAEYSFAKIKESKKRGYYVAACGGIACIVLSFVLIGNPFTAINAKSALDEYAEKKYPHIENAALGEFDFSNIYYRYDTGAYAIDAVSSRYPTESAMITYSNGNIHDGFERHMKEKLCEPYSLELTDIFRKAFPNDTFEIECDRIISMPGESILSAKEKTLYSNLSYDVYLAGVQSVPEMLKRVEGYMNVLDDSGFAYDKIVFKSGVNPWLRRSITVSSNHIKYNAPLKIDRVHAGTSNFFNEFIASTLDVE